MPHDAKLVILSDLHLRGDGADPQGIDTAMRLDLAVARIADLHADADLVIFAGDLSDDGSAASYEVFARAAARLPLPWIATPGNHDSRAGFAAIATPHPRTGRFDTLRDLPGGGRVVVLDTLSDGAEHGEVTADQLAWLDTCDLGPRGLVVTHHPLQRLGIWTDRIALRTPDPLARVLARAAAPPTLIAGHIHMNSAGVWRGMPAVTLSGNHFTVAPLLDTVPEDRALPLKFHEGPAEYAVVLMGAEGVVVHFESYVRDTAPFAPARVAALLAGH